MQTGQYRFICRFTDKALLPEYKGSTLRGVLGHSLKRVTCALRQQNCETCLLFAKCVYAQFFETQKSDASATLRMAAPPKPYVLQVPLTRQREFEAGQTLTFSILLFGQANEYLPYLVYAFKHLGELGIGKSLNGQRARFVLQEVWNGETNIYQTLDDQLGKAECPELRFQDLQHEATALSRIEVEFLTPLRIKHENSFARERLLPFHLLVRALLRRVASLEEHFGLGEPNLDYPGLVEKARQIEIEDSDLQWSDWSRYSSRQDAKMMLGGLLGRISYHGDLSAFLPLLRYGEIFHIGKQTTFGLGQYRLSIV